MRYADADVDTKHSLWIVPHSIRTQYTRKDYETSQPDFSLVEVAITRYSTVSHGAKVVAADEWR